MWKQFKDEKPEVDTLTVFYFDGKYFVGSLNLFDEVDECGFLETNFNSLYNDRLLWTSLEQLDETLLLSHSTKQ